MLYGIMTTGLIEKRLKGKPGKGKPGFEARQDEMHF